MDSLSTNLSEGERIIRLYKQERLEALTVDMVVTYSLVGDTQNTRKYTQLAPGIMKAIVPPGHEDIGRWRILG